MERTPAPSPTLHPSANIAPTNQLGSPLSVFSRSLSSKYLLCRRSRSTLKLGGTAGTLDVPVPILSSLAKCTQSPPQEDSDSKTTILPQAQSGCDGAVQSATANNEPTSTNRSPRVPLIVATFRKFRHRRTKASEANVKQDSDEVITAPSLPSPVALSPLFQALQQPVLSVNRSMSTPSFLAAPGYALRSTYSESRMQLLSRREPIPPFTRNQSSSSLAAAGGAGAVTFPRRASSLAAEQFANPPAEKRGFHDGLGIVGVVYCARKGKYSVTGLSPVDDHSPSDEGMPRIAQGEVAQSGNAVLDAEEEEGILIDAGIVVLREATVPPVSPKEITKRVPPPHERLAKKDSEKSLLSPRPHLIVTSQPMMRDAYNNSTETTASGESGTEAGGGSEFSRREPGSEESDPTTGSDAMGLGDVPNPTKIFVSMEDEDGTAENRSPGTAHLENFSRLPPSPCQHPPPSKPAVRPWVTTTFLPSPLLLSPGHPTARLEPSPEPNLSSPIADGKRSRSMNRLFRRSGSRSPAPSDGQNGTSPGMKKSITGLGMLGKRGRAEKGERGGGLDHAPVLV